MSEEASRLLVAIDGPSGSGKSTVSRAVATALRAAYLDTGAMYRALTWWCLHQGVDLADTTAVGHLSTTLPLDLVLDPADPRVSVAGTDVTTAIRDPRVTGAVSAVATNLDVRAELRARQRALLEEGLARCGRVVAEGRDITTVVAPDADVRILLTATEPVRLARRAHEQHGSVDADALAATREHVVRRDRLDSAVASFTDAAEGVLALDTSLLTVDEAVDAVLEAVRAVAPEGGIPRAGRQP